jgi:hypothetical protein
MQDHYIFDEADFAKVGIVCPQCGTEAVFDLSKDQAANTSRSCPGCGYADFLELFVNEARRNYNWITWYKRLLELPKKSSVRLYFKKPTV